MTSHDPYLPPVAEEPAPEADAMGKASKPFSVVWVQLLGAGFVLALLWSIGHVVVDGARGGYGKHAVVATFMLASQFALLVFFVFTVVGAHLRAGYGRVLGLVFILMIFLSSLSTKVAQFISPDADPGQIVARDRFGALIVQGLVYLLMFYWFYAFGFSGKARRYFRCA
jgi:hypothetical protein